MSAVVFDTQFWNDVVGADRQGIGGICWDSIRSVGGQAS